MLLKHYVTLLLSFVCCHVFAQQKGYYRTPCIYQNTVVFTAEGDLWKYDLSSGITARLTTNPGMEKDPIFSKDGKKVIFTGEYEGIPELYDININGGVPRRLTWEFDNSGIHACGYTNNGHILFRTASYSTLPSTQLITLDPVSLVTQPIPLAQASFGTYDENGVLFFTRFPNQGSKTKRYKGGFIEQVWRFDGKQEAICLTADFDGTSTSPMVYKDRVYFISDRDGTMNLWSMTKEGKDLKQHSFSSGWDLQSPSISNANIVYQKGADIWLYDIATGKEKMLDISLLSDFDQRKPKWIKSPVNSISNADISPNGNYAAIISRGRVFVSPAKSDRWVEVTRKSGIRFKEVHFINDKSLALLSDESGEFEVWKVNADGSDTAKQITKNSKTLITYFSVSPDEKHIVYNDKNEVLRIADVATGEVKFTYDSSYGGVFEAGWSPDSRFLNITRSIENSNTQICVLDMHTMQMTPITTTRLNSYAPSWSADSNWLYFVSERNLQTKITSPWGARQPEPIYTETQNIYAIPLDSAATFPFLSTDSWLTDTVFTPAVAAANMATDKKSKKKTPLPPVVKNYNWNQLSKTLYQVPVKSANLGSFAALDGYLYWIDMGHLGNQDGGKLFALKIEESKKYEPVEIAAGVGGFSPSANKKKLLIFFQNQTIAIADANGQKLDMDKAKLELDNWNFVLNPIQDWQQMFDDAWRMMRDYFYDRDMHQVDWVAIKQHYQPLLARVTDRYELDDLIAQMVAELSALHTFVYGGDKRKSPDYIPTGFLGAQLTKTTKGLAITHIFKSDPDYPDFSSPLNKPELKIKEGDIITQVNNVSVLQVNNIAELLANKVNIPVKLGLLNASNQSYEQIVTPFDKRNDYFLRYGEWELERRAKVDSLSQEEIGYIHLQAMSGEDMDAFVKQYYPVFNRKGLIIDVRSNNGGNIDSWVLEKLMRKAWMYWQARSGGPTWNMQYAFNGHMVMLCNQETASDGEAVSEGFRRLGLGKVIGMRTWGGEIWLSGSNRLVDNGIASAAEFGVYGPEGTWLIEGRGVEPDFVVDNLPYETYQGKDAQLQFAVDYLQKQIKANPVIVPKAPPHPNKSFKYPQQP